MEDNDYTSNDEYFNIDNFHGIDNLDGINNFSGRFNSDETDDDTLTPIPFVHHHDVPSHKHIGLIMACGFFVIFLIVSFIITPIVGYFLFK